MGNYLPICRMVLLVDPKLGHFKRRCVKLLVKFLGKKTCLKQKSIPENGWLGDYFFVGKAYAIQKIHGLCLVLGRVTVDERVLVLGHLQRLIEWMCML